MVATNSSPSFSPDLGASLASPPPAHRRQNRRQRRSSLRARHAAMSCKSALASDLNGGILEAQDSSFSTPNHRPGNGPSQIPRQADDQCWMVRKARQVAESQRVVVKGHMEQLEMEKEMMIEKAEREEEKELRRIQHRLFGGEDDDEDVSRDIDLCPAMLDVVKRLFDGEADYLDPE